MYLQWGIFLGAYHTNRLNQEILCWKYKLVYHLGKIRTHWHTEKVEKDTHSSSTSVLSVCSSDLDFKLMPTEGLSLELEMRLRCQRLVESGLWICEEFPR